jgi:thiopeptide-type bacteriocin biosynthesis protein
MRQFTTSGFFVLRTPALPFEEFLALSAQASVPAALTKEEGLDEAVTSDRQLIRGRLQQMVSRPEVKEALWIASPEFVDSLALWWREPESEKGRKLEQSLYRYIARMTSRATPFGLFAGCSVGGIGGQTRLALGPRNEYWRRSRLDMEYLCNLAEKIIADPALRGNLLFRPNTSLYLAAGRYHHVQGYFIEQARAYRLVATDSTPYLDVTLQRAQGGATPVALASALVQDDPEILLEEALEYIGQLIESQLLVAELVPPITGPEPVDDMIAQLNMAGTSSVAGALSAVANRLQTLDQQKLGNDLGLYQELVKTISELPASYKVDHLVQVDMMKPAPGASLDQRLINEILRGVETLHSLNSGPPQDFFRQFKQDFTERYQDQQVPLVWALDDEVGIGFEKSDSASSMAEPLLDGLEIGREPEEQPARSRKGELALLRKLEELARSGKTVLELDAALTKALRAESPSPLPDAFSVMGSVGSGDANKPSFHLQSVSGPSGAILLGRFCHADSRLNDCVQEHLRAEEALGAEEEVVFAEIAHLPEGRIGNVLFRPALRRYEIPFLASSRMPVDQQIPVTDLSVSVENNQVVLRSRRLARRVLPRLTSAHGFYHGRNLKLYKFLCLLQTQGLAGGLSWNWGTLEHASFLPRVTYGKLVFSLARWTAEKEVIEKLSREQGADRIRAVHQWREQMAVPRFVLLTEVDNQLLIDFDNVLSVDTFVEYAKKRSGVRLVELFASPEELAAHSPEGGFTHEVVIPFVRSAPALKRTTVPSANLTQAAPAVQAAAEQRNFLPGSEWLYAKIYGSASHLDRLLLESIKPLVEKALAAGDADGWFFIRYGDPHWHLRLRFHGNPQRLSAHIIPQLWQAVQQHASEGKVSRLQFDTYEREIERYGGLEGVEIAERLFESDSKLVLELLSSISSHLGSGLRWRVAFLSVDRLLSALGFDTAARRQLLNSLGKFQEKNFLVNDRYKKQLSDKFRKERQSLEALLESPAGLGDVPGSIHTALAEYEGKLNAIRGQLESAKKTGKLTKTIPELASSYIHMHLNRMFRSAANAQEMVLYDFLTRTYDSRLAKEKRSANLPANQSAVHMES